MRGLLGTRTGPLLLSLPSKPSHFVANRSRSQIDRRNHSESRSSTRIHSSVREHIAPCNPRLVQCSPHSFTVAPSTTMPPINPLAVRITETTEFSENRERSLGEHFVNDIMKLPQVSVHNPVKVAEKLDAMIAGGRDTLQVISDFDYTLSRFTNDAGERLSTTHGVFDDNAKRIDPVLGKKFDDLRAKYYPIEFDPSLTIKEKTPHMHTWWQTSHNYIVQSGFTHAMIEDFVRQSRVVLRDGVSRFLSTLESSRVPLVLFSAGIGNIIEIFLQQQLGRSHQNIHLISNMMRFDDQGRVASFSEPLIHTFCKNSSVIRQEHDFFHHIANRTHVILLGDSMGDINMATGVERNETTIKIGFYNGDTSDTNLLAHYQAGYDIVLVADQTMRVPQLLLDAIGNGTAAGAINH